MSHSSVKIPRIDTRRDEVRPALLALRERLSPQGNVVSEAGRQKTLDVFGSPLTPAEVVDRICTSVQKEGIAAVCHYSRVLDHAEINETTIRVSDEELENAHRQASDSLLSAVRQVRDNITTFQKAILHRDCLVEKTEGVRLRHRYTPLRRVGICVPGGAAAYPSTVLMTAVPAQVAGVEEIAVMAPPTRFGANNPNLLATCRELGIREVYRMGGAQGIAALAYGVTGVAPVDKIVGPGNLFVALAKRQVYGHVDIDSIAGPSEVVVVADSDASPAHLAADLMAQAEHAPGASVLIAWDDELLDLVEQELATQIMTLDRKDVTIQSLENFGAMLRVRDLNEACEWADWIAPEHLHLALADATRMVDRIRNAGATFVGYFTPVAVGDYVAGPSHVLPTSGTARWASGLSSNSFLRSSSVIEYSPHALARIAPSLAVIAECEGLTAHRQSVEIRLTTSEDRKGP